MKTLGSDWPITPRLLWTAVQSPMATQRGAQFVAQIEGQTVGFSCLQINERPNGTLGANLGIVLVDPAYQRQGIGRALVDHVLAAARNAGAVQIQLGGLYPRIWPGVPDNLPGARAFFEHCGWEFPPPGHNDLVADIRGFTVADDLRERMTRERITLEPANADDAPAIVKLQQENFAGWADTYRHVLRIGDYEDVLVARDPDKGIIGSLLMCSPYSNPIRSEMLWQVPLGADLGSMGEVGVMASERKRGVGLALVAYGADVLRRRGVANCIIGWTTLVDFYGKLGWHVWQQYHISRRALT